MRCSVAIAVVMLVLACSKESVKSPTGAGTATGAGTPGGAGEGKGATAATAKPIDAGPAVDTGAAKRSIPKPIPSGNLQIAYNCFHSDMPFGKGEQSYTTLIDLAAGTVDTGSSISTGNENDTPTPTPPKTTHSQTKLDAGRIATLKARLADLLAGGPYREEYPPSEGTPCDLIVQVAGQKPFFTMEKSFTNEKDAASALVKAIGGQP